MKHLLIIFSLLLTSVSWSEDNKLNLYLICQDEELSLKSKKIWDERTLLYEEALTYQKFIDGRIDYLNRMYQTTCVGGCDIDTENKYLNEIYRLQEKRISKISNYKIRISRLNNALLRGNDSLCFKSEQQVKNIRPKLGVMVQEINEEIANTIQHRAGVGVLVKSVTSKSLAEYNNIIPGDIILTLDEKPITNPTDLVNELSKVSSGQVFSLMILRKGELISKQIRIN